MPLAEQKLVNYAIASYHWAIIRVFGIKKSMKLSIINKINKNIMHKLLLKNN